MPEANRHMHRNEALDPQHDPTLSGNKRLAALEFPNNLFERSICSLRLSRCALNYLTTFLICAPSACSCCTLFSITATSSYISSSCTQNPAHQMSAADSSEVHVTVQYPDDCAVDSENPLPTFNAGTCIACVCNAAHALINTSSFPSVSVHHPLQNRHWMPTVCTLTEWKRASLAPESRLLIRELASNKRELARVSAQIEQQASPPHPSIL